MKVKARAGFVVAMLFVLALCLAGCSSGGSGEAASSSASGTPSAGSSSATDEGASSGSPESSESSGEFQPTPNARAVGDTVKTDLVRLTLDGATFAKKLAGPASDWEDDRYMLPAEGGESGEAITAAKGNTLVALQLTVENLGGTSFNLDDSGFAYDFITVRYGNALYGSRDFADKEWYSVNYVGKFGKSKGTVNLLVDCDGPEPYRGYIEIPVRVDDLSDPFELTFTLPKSNGKTKSFTFTV